MADDGMAKRIIAERADKVARARFDIEAASQNFALKSDKCNDLQDKIENTDVQGLAIIGIAERAARIWQARNAENPTEDFAKSFRRALKDAVVGEHLQMAELSSVLVHLREFWEQGDKIKECAGVIIAGFQDNSTLPSAVDAYVVKNGLSTTTKDFVEVVVNLLEKNRQADAALSVKDALNVAYGALVNDTKYRAVDKTNARRVLVEELTRKYPQMGTDFEEWKNAFATRNGSSWRDAAKDTVSNGPSCPGDR